MSVKTFFGVVESTPRELHITFVRFRASVVHRPEAHVYVGFDKLHANAFPSPVVVFVMHGTQCGSSAPHTVSHLVVKRRPAASQPVATHHPPDSARGSNQNNEP